MHDEGRKFALSKGRIALAENDRMFMKNMVSAIFAHHAADIIGDKEHTDLLWAVSYYSAVDGWKS